METHWLRAVTLLSAAVLAACGGKAHHFQVMRLIGTLLKLALWMFQKLQILILQLQSVTQVVIFFVVMKMAE